MALHDFYCSQCRTVQCDVNIPIAIGATAGAPVCATCQQPMDWIPQTRAMDVGGVKGAAFKAFDTYDGKNQKVRISNMRDLRRVEKESEQQARNGEGQPIVFRRWHQNDSNKDVHTLAPTFTGGEQPTEAAKRRFGKTLQKAATAPDTGYGPGVTDANASALPD